MRELTGESIQCWRLGDKRWRDPDRSAAADDYDTTAEPGGDTGSEHSFSVVASGSAPFTYQWYLNASSFSNGNGGRSSTFSKSSVVSSDAGNDTVVVANAAGPVTSVAATLTVYVPPGIQTQPTNLTLTQGQSATNLVVANGSTPFSYQWNLNGLPVSGAPVQRWCSPALRRLTPAATRWR